MDGADGCNGNGYITGAELCGVGEGGCRLGGNASNGGGAGWFEARGVCIGETSVGSMRRGSTSGAAHCDGGTCVVAVGSGGVYDGRYWIGGTAANDGGVGWVDV